MMMIFMLVLLLMIVKEMIKSEKLLIWRREECVVISWPGCLFVNGVMVNNRLMDAARSQRELEPLFFAHQPPFFSCCPLSV